MMTMQLREKRKVMPGTCEACVFGRGRHADSCEHWLVKILRADPIFEGKKIVAHPGPAVGQAIRRGLTTNNNLWQTHS